MPPVHTAVRRLSALAVAGLVAVALAACAPGFDPTGPCTTDGFAPGAYPDLEALVPTTFQERGPDRLDSGRNCTEGRLGTLWSDGVRELRFAGGLWELGAESGATLAVFTADGLTAEAMADFYEAGARDAPDTSDLTRSTIRLGTGDGHRLDLDNDGYLQTVVAWSPADDAPVRVVLVSTAARDVAGPEEHERTVQEAVKVFDLVPVGSG
jgi:hypothetical protein